MTVPITKWYSAPDMTIIAADIINQSSDAEICERLAHHLNSAFAKGKQIGSGETRMEMQKTIDELEERIDNMRGDSW